MAEQVVLTEVDGRGVATVTLNRPAVNNAYNGEMILGLIDAFQKFGADPAVRVVTIRGNGRHFQAGADLKWRSEEHTSELQSLMRNSYAVFCLKKKNNINKTH